MMKKTFSSALLLLMAFMHFAYAQTSREVIQLRDFNAVSVSHGIKARLVKGNENKIEITASGIAMDRVEASVKDETLQVRLAKGNFKNHVVDVVITYRDIQGLEATSNASIIATAPIEAAEAYVFATTGSYIEAKIEAELMNVEIATNAKVFLSGEADRLNIKAYTNAELDGKRFEADHVNILANTAAKASFTVGSTMEGSVATAAKVFYSGNPSTLDIKTSTGGAISKQ